MSATADEPAGAWPEGLEPSFYADSSLTIPGKGDRPDSCGAWFPREFCDECGEPHFGQSRCQLRTCPECWRTWAGDRAESITERLAGARHVADGGLASRAVHAVLSPPPGSIKTLQQVYDGFREAYRLAEEKGVRGGVAVFHGWRVEEDAKELWRAEREYGRTDLALWAWVRERPERWRQLTYWSPHYHVIGLCEDFEADDPDEQEGWVARRIRSLSPFKIDESDGYDDMMGCARYLMSHMGFEAGESKDMVRWFGDLATANFSLDDLDAEDRYLIEEMVGDVRSGEGGEEEPEECENCGCTRRSSIYEAGAALADRRWVERIGHEQERKLRGAFEWMIGDFDPPPDLEVDPAAPPSEEAARDVLEAIA